MTARLPQRSSRRCLRSPARRRTVEPQTRQGRLSGGRPRGSPNKFTGELKVAILAGVNGANKRGVAGFVCDLAQDIPASAAALLGRLIPVNMAGALDLNLTVRHIDETAEEPPPQPDVKPGFPTES
jgi:hypothetical protein